MKIMFLGGPLDHAVREVDTVSGIPPENYYSADWDVYRAYRVRTQPATLTAWWCYIAAGHNPTTEQLLHTQPQEART